MHTQYLTGVFLRFISPDLEEDYQLYYLKSNNTTLRRFSAISFIFSTIILIISVLIFLEINNEIRGKKLTLLYNYEISDLLRVKYEDMKDVPYLNLDKILVEVLHTHKFYNKYLLINENDNVFLHDLINFLDVSYLINFDSLHSEIENINSINKNSINKGFYYNYTQAMNDINNHLWNLSSVSFNDFNNSLLDENNITSESNLKEIKLNELTNNLLSFIENNDAINSIDASNSVRRSLFGKGAFISALFSFSIHFFLVFLSLKITTYRKLIIFFFFFCIFYGINFHILAGILRSYFNFISDTLFVMLGIKMIFNQLLISKITINWIILFVINIVKSTLEFVFLYLNHYNFNYTLIFYFMTNFILDVSSIFICRNNEIFLKSNFFYFTKLKNEKKYLDNLIQNIGHGFISFDLFKHKIIKSNKFYKNLFQNLKHEVIVLEDSLKLNNVNSNFNEINIDKSRKYSKSSHNTKGLKRSNLSLNSQSMNSSNVNFFKSKLNLVNENKHLNCESSFNKAFIKDENIKYLKSNINDDLSYNKQNKIKNIEKNSEAFNELPSLNEKEDLSELLLVELLLLNLVDINENLPDNLKEKILNYIKEKKLNYLHFQSPQDFKIINENFNINNNSNALFLSVVKYITNILSFYPMLFSEENFLYLGKIILSNTLQDILLSKGQAQGKSQKFMHKKQFEVYIRIARQNTKNQSKIIDIMLYDVSIIIKKENKKVIDQCKNIYLSKSAHELKNPITSCKECILEVKDNFYEMIKNIPKLINKKIKKMPKPKEKLFSDNNDLNSNSCEETERMILFQQVTNKQDEENDNENIISNKNILNVINENYSTQNIFKILEYLSLQLDIMNEFLDGIGIFSTQLDNKENNNNENHNNNQKNRVKKGMLLSSYPTRKDITNDFNIDLLNKSVMTITNRKNLNNNHEELAAEGNQILDKLIVNRQSKLDSKHHEMLHNNDTNIHNITNYKQNKKSQNIKDKVQSRDDSLKMFLLTENPQEECKIIMILCEQIRNFNNLLEFEHKSKVKFSDNILIFSQDYDIYILASYQLLKSMFFYIFYHCYKNITNGIILISIQKDSINTENFLENNLIVNFTTPKVLFDQNIIDSLSESLEKHDQEEQNNFNLFEIKNFNEINKENFKSCMNNNDLKTKDFFESSYELGIDQFSSEDFNNYFFIYIILIIAKKLKVKIKIENKSNSSIFQLFFTIDHVTSQIKNKNLNLNLYNDKSQSPEKDDRKFFNKYFLEKENCQQFRTDSNIINTSNLYLNQTLNKKEKENEKENKNKSFNNLNNKNINVTFLSVYQNNVSNILNINNCNKEKLLNQSECINSECENRSQSENKFIVDFEVLSNQDNQEQSCKNTNNINLYTSTHKFSPKRINENLRKHNIRKNLLDMSNIFESPNISENLIQETKRLSSFNLNINYNSSEANMTNNSKLANSNLENFLQRMDKSTHRRSLCNNLIDPRRGSLNILSNNLMHKDSGSKMKSKFSKEDTNLALHKNEKRQTTKFHTINMRKNINFSSPNFFQELLPAGKPVNRRKNNFMTELKSKLNDSVINKSNSTLGLIYNKQNISKKNIKKRPENQRNVLIVEDEELIRNSLKRFFNRINEESSRCEGNTFYNVYEACNGLEAISVIYTLFLNNILIDFSITDEMMPYLKGSGLVKFYKKLVRDGKFYNMMFISYTSYTSNEILDKIKNSGIEYVINKPTDYLRFKNLINLLERTIRLKTNTL